ncbi:toxin VasX [Pseudomonas protegens]|uniref:toxin VasX n=1 Tax=Pseudomonas protegens TaxID=380021 RepID=UPI0031F58FF1
MIGKAHPESQKLVLLDQARSPLKGKQEPLEKELCSSVLHVWDSAGLAKGQLCLEIATTRGAPIRLPLLDNLRSTPRQSDAQWNQLVPVLPFVALPGSKSAYDLGTPVLARNGYVYVFHEQRLWRELEVRIEEGKTTYHDIDVAQFRQGQGFKPGERKASGQALDDIWLPASWNDRRVDGLQLCFSEVQFSAPRLQRLEQDAKLRGQRCRSPDLRSAEQRFKRLYKNQPDGTAMLQAFAAFDVHDATNQSAAAQARTTWLNLQSGAFPVSVAAPQRPRAPGYEWMLEHPGSYLCDLSGQFPVQASTQAKAFLQACTTGSTEQSHGVALELTAIADALEASLPAPEPEPGSKPEAEGEKADLWQAQDSVADVLESARQRQLCGVLLDDPRYRVRHLHMRLNTHHQLLMLCARRAAQEPNHGSALLVQQLVVPRQLAGQANALHAGMKKLNDTGKQAINRCTATVERAMVLQHMNSAQDLLSECLEQGVTQQAFADHLSLEGFDYLAALFTLSQAIATIALPPGRLDPLSPTGDVVDAVTGVSLYSPKASRAQKLLSSIADDKASTWHQMLWPTSDLETVCVPYKVPTQDDPNLGDGCFRPTELAKHENQAPPPLGQQVLLDSALLATLLASDRLDTFLTANGKNTSAALIAFFENLQGAVDTALAATAAPRNAARQAAQTAAASRTASTQANERLNQMRERLGAQAQPVNITLHGRGVQQLRSLMPATFGAAYFMRRGAVTQSYYLFGMEDLPTRQVRTKRIHGEFLDAHGNVLGSTSRTRMSGADIASAEHWVLVIPRNHSTAQLVGSLNRQINAAQQADSVAAADAANSTRARSALNDAREHLSRQRGKTHTWRVLNSRPFAAAVLMLEMWNVRAEVQAFEETSRQKGSFRAIGGLASASIDLVIAMEALTVKLIGSQSTEAFTRKAVYTVSDETINKRLGSRLGAAVTKKLSARLIVQSIGGLIFAGVSLNDAWYAWQWNDQAMYGYLLMTGGALSGVASGLLSGMTTLLGMNPLGWLALLLTSIGAGLVLWLSSTQLEDWLNAGPFGTKDGFPHLQEPREAFYRLLGVLAGISIAVGRNPLFEPNAKLDSRAEVPHSVRSADTLIRIKSRLPGLLVSLGSVDIEADCRLCEVITHYSIKGSPYRTDIQAPTMCSIPKAQRLYNDSLELYFSTPPANRSPSPFEIRNWHWAVRAQLVLKNGAETRCFPAPKVKDSILYGSIYAKADFNQVNRSFWADEQTHKEVSSE